VLSCLASLSSGHGIPERPVVAEDRPQALDVDLRYVKLDQVVRAGNGVVTRAGRVEPPESFDLRVRTHDGEPQPVG